MEKLNSIEEAIEDIREGRIVIVVDDADRENEGDMIMAAEKVTPEAINFLSKYARGLVCAPLPKERIEQLDLVPMVKVNTAKMGTRFTVSVDVIENTTTGISAHDRAETIRALINSETKPEDLARPGHIFPIQAMDGGVLSRAGHTEATVDLARLAGLYPAGVLCEIMDDDGHMARLPKLLKMAKKFDMKVITVKDLIEYRRRKEKLVQRVVTVNFPTK
ncbi:MAG: 3,4-dihydroxy-2-butanone-4-phosphate synthase, partial [Candidatus Zixiibacteriota bacterium]